LTSHSSKETLERIHAALESARTVLKGFTPGAIEAKFKVGDDPITAADHAVDDVLRKTLLRDGEGWLSEETVDDFTRLHKQRVWVVDPLDGTREFVQGIPEFCVSIAMVENGIPVAGGICNPATDEIILGSLDTGVTYNGQTSQPSQRKDLHGATVLASRSEVKRGEWKQFESAEFNVRPMGSVAYKLGLVAAGRADLTFTLVPKNEWDVAAGAALVESAGGWVLKLDNSPLRCNQKDPLISGLLAGSPFLKDPLLALLERQAQTVNTAKDS
jgi:myo-inositol-1(or 4)-monophosphatase